VTAEVIDGKAIAADLRRRVAEVVAARVAAGRRAPGLATVLVGDDPASHVYVASKRKACAEAGIRSIHHELPGDVSEPDLVALVAELDADRDVDGILVQMPLPDRIDQGSSPRSRPARTSTASPRSTPGTSPRGGSGFARRSTSSPASRSSDWFRARRRA